VRRSGHKQGAQQKQRGGLEHVFCVSPLPIDEERRGDRGCGRPNGRPHRQLSGAVALSPMPCPFLTFLSLGCPYSPLCWCLRAPQCGKAANSLIPAMYQLEAHVARGHRHACADPQRVASIMLVHFHPIKCNHKCK